MHPVLSFNKIPLFVRVLIAGAGLAAVLMLALPAPGRGRRVRPPSRPPAAPLAVESHPRAGPLILTSLLVGPEPRVFTPGRQIVSTFITDDGESLHVVATGRLPGPGATAIHWSVVTPVGFMPPVDGHWDGPRLDVVLRRPGGNPSGLGGPLSLTVRARAQENGEACTASETVVQDERDQLRQEYVDLARRSVPDRSEFMDAAAFAARYGRRYPWLHFEDLNWSVNGNTGLHYSYAIIRPELVEGLDQVRRIYGGIVINSGYRNPVHQVEVHAPVRESLHQYGFAADLAVAPGEGRALPNEVDWRRLAEVACSARARWVEPLASSAPNSPGCHVHLDYRPGPVSSAPVRLHGQVLEVATGRPVAGALVLLGAMPARTDANGLFGIRNVLGGGLHPVEVHADGFETLEQPVPLVAWGRAFVRLALHPAVHRPFVLEVASTHWLDQKSRLLVARLRVSNTGAGDVRDVRLSVTPTQALLISQDPTALGPFPAGAVRGVDVALRLRSGQTTTSVPISVALLYRGVSGAEERSQAVLSLLPPGALPPAGSLRVSKKPLARPAPLPRALERAQPVTPAPAAVPPGVPKAGAPTIRTSEPAKAGGTTARPREPKPASSQSAPDSAKPTASTVPSPDPAPPAHESGSTQPQTEPPAPAPSTPPASAGGEPKPASPGETKPPQTGAPAGAASPAGPP